MRARGITRARKRGREDERPKTSARNVRATGKRALSPGAAHSHACERCACPCRPAAAARLPRRFGPDRHSWDGGTGESAVRPGLTRPCMPPRLTFATKKLSTSAQGQKEVPPFRRSPRPPPMQLRIRQRLGTARDDSEAVLCLRWFQKALAFKTYCLKEPAGFHGRTRASFARAGGCAEGCRGLTARRRPGITPQNSIPKKLQAIFIASRVPYLPSHTGGCAEGCRGLQASGAGHGRSSLESEDQTTA